jgi:ribosomal protein S18 acetylase RimI-like enzyme
MHAVNNLDGEHSAQSDTMTTDIGAEAIRSLESRDREPIGRILQRTGMFTEDEIAIAFELIDIVLQKPNQQDYVINVLQDDGILGYYCVGPTPGTSGTFDLYWIAVDPSAQGRGIGTMLIQHVEDFVRSRHGRLVIAETSSQPRYEKTRRFYVSCGYSQLARIPEYYRVGDDLVVFGKPLN